jgi:PAT family beta-lactamase induction signal transducer AmpG
VKRDVLAVFRSRRMAAIALLGFSSGLPLLLVGQTMQAWLTDAHISVKSIARFASIGLPYTFKFAWAPLLDRYQLPWLGRRRGWILAFQLLLMAALTVLSMIDPATDTEVFATLAVVVATLSASQDVVIDAYNTDTLAPEERAAGSAVYVAGYRIAMLTAGSLAMVLADHFVWRGIYVAMAGAMTIGIAGTLLAEEPVAPARPSRTLVDLIVRPFEQYFRELGRPALVVLAFAATYKFGEQFAQVLTIKFYRSVGFTNTEVGTLNKAVGTAAFLLGGALGGALVARWGIRRLLVPFGVLGAIVHLAYLWIAVAGKDRMVFGTAIAIENVSFAMGTMALLATLMATTSPAVSATQYALLTSLTTVGQRVFGPLAGDVQAAVGWKGFFLVAIALAIPGIVLAHFAGRVASEHRAPHDDAAELPGARASRRPATG